MIYINHTPAERMARYDEDVRNGHFLSDPRHNTLAGWLRIFAIIGEVYHPANGRIDITPGHDILHLPIDLGDVEQESDLGWELIGLGCHYDEDAENWAIFA